MALCAVTYDNPWIAAVDRAGRRVPGWLVAVVGAAAATLPAFTSAPVAGAVGGGLGGMALIYLAAFAPLYVIAAVGGLLEGRSVWRREPRPAAALGIGLAVGAGGFLAAAGLAAAAGAMHAGSGLPGGPAVAGALAAILLVLFQAGAEETLFRGWMQPVLCARWGPWVGLGATALLFAALHLGGGVRTPLAFINVVLAGLLFGLLALRGGGLLAPVAAHTAWNWTEANALGLEPNPGLGPGGAFVDLDLVGSGLWGGGGDGMNGSLAVTLVLAALTLAALAAGPRRPA